MTDLRSGLPQHSKSTYQSNGGGQSNEGRPELLMTEAYFEVNLTFERARCVYRDFLCFITVLS